MSLKDILVIVDDTDRSEARLRIAATIGRESGARLAVICPRLALSRPPRSLEPMDIAYGLPGVAPVQERPTEPERLAYAEDQANAVCSRAGISADWIEDGDIDAAGLAALARTADLVVFGQTDPDLSYSVQTRKLPEDVLIEGGRPVLLVPYAGPAEAPFRRVLIAWDASRAASRALHDALPLLPRAGSGGEVLVLRVDPDPAEAEFGRSATGAGAVAAHLVRHDIAARVRNAIAAGLPTGDVILNHAADMMADLLVMGGYGHTRLREHLIGGVTLDVLRTMTLPVLMSH
jgi:nucleotide-binding universal stress UspA family protein